MVALLAVGREGLETALFLWAGAQATGASAAPLLGAALGLATAVAARLARVPRRGAAQPARCSSPGPALFLVVVAAGVLAYGVHDLQEAGILPGLNNLAFDVSAAVPPSSWYGTLLKGTVNFSPATTWLEAIAWMAYIVPTLYFFVRTTWGSAPARPSATAPAVPASAA